MKKITLFIACILFASSTYAQQVLSHSVSQTPDGSGIGCRSNPDQAPGTGDEGISDNIFYRAYTPSNFGFTGNFDAMGISFIAIFSDIGGSNPTVTNTVRLYTSDQTFPAGTLTEIASKDFTVTAADDGVQFDVMFDNPVTVSATTELIVAVDIAEAPDPPNNYDFAIAQNDLGQNAPGYISSNGCGINPPDTFANIGFPDNHIILNLLGDTNLNTDDFALSKVSIYPNPTNDILNLRIPSNLSVNNASMYDALGRKAKISYSNDIIDVSNLASGIYILKIETSAGDLSKKVIIK
jgi:hypothetical protein